MRNSWRVGFFAAAIGAELMFGCGRSENGSTPISAGGATTEGGDSGLGETSGGETSAGGSSSMGDAGATSAGAPSGGEPSGEGGMGSNLTGCDATPAAPPSCEGGAETCGISGEEDCCETLCVEGDTFSMGRKEGDPDDLACDSTYVCWPEETPESAASVRTFWLDRFEVTVGRFRKFVDAVADGYQPEEGSGTHGYLNEGSETGWDDGWPMPSSKGDWNTALGCDTSNTTWTPTPDDNEERPINCVNWYEAEAFCIWDGGFLPTEAEWELAATAGEERVFPWSVPATASGIDTNRACYIEGCLGSAPAVVGSTPNGNGPYAHADLSGNVTEWTLDWLSAGYQETCSDCYSDAASGSRTARGGGWEYDPVSLRAVVRHSAAPDAKSTAWGARCARAAVE